MHRLVGPLALALALVSGPALAADPPSDPVEATGIRLSPALASGALQGAFFAELAGAAVDIAAPRLRVDVYEFETLQTPLVNHLVEDRSTTYELTDATGTLREGSEGWLALYGEAGASQANLVAASLALDGAAEPIGNTDDERAGSAGSSLPLYAYAPGAPYLLATGAMEVSTEGMLTAKLFGPTLVLRSASGDREEWTGMRDSPRAPGATITRWLVVSAEEGSARVDAPAAELAFDALRATTEGRASIRGAEGDREIDGPIAVDVSPAGGSRAPTMRAQVTASSGALVPLRAWDGAGAPLWIPLAVGLAGVAVGAGAMLALRRRPRPEERLGADELIDLAYAAADGGRYADALGWIRRARLAAPQSERLRLDEAAFLAELGDLDRARALYEEVAARSAAGEADYLLACLLARHGEAPAARRHLLRALELTPSLALEAPDDPRLAPLLRDTATARAVREAARRADDDGRAL